MAEPFTAFQSELPSSYIQFIESHNGWEGDLGEELGYVVIWNRETIEERWDGYQVTQYLTNRWFPFGSNGGGEMLCFDLRSRTDGVLWIPYIGMSEEEAMPQDFTFAAIADAIRKAVAREK